MVTVTGTATAMAPHKVRTIVGLWAIGLGVTASAWAGEWQITPSISVDEKVTDNVGLTERNRDGDWITNIAPGINITGTGDRVKLRFDYKLHNLYYANESSRNNRQNSLNATGSLEAIDNWLFVDASARIAQQNRSAFRGSTDTSVDPNNSGNTAETRTYRISPYIKGVFGNAVDYQLRYTDARSSTDAAGIADTETRQWSGRLAGTKTLANFGWSIDANTQHSDFGRGRDTSADLLRGVLTYHYDPQFRLLLIAGREANDYVSADKESHTIRGGGFEWAPTQRTLFSASREKRFFGDSDSITFSHRTAGTAWKYRQTKDTVTSTSQGSSTLGTYFDLLDSMLSSSIPDPDLRASVVNALLQAQGISPQALLQGGFLTTGVTLQKRRELSFALNGVRNTVTFAATRSESQSLSQGFGSGLFLGTDFADLRSVTQNGVNVNWSHKLTGLSTLTGSVSHLKSEGKGSTSVSTDQTIYSVNFVTQLGPKTNAGLGARRTEVDGTTNYTENAVTGLISHRF